MAARTWTPKERQRQREAIQRWKLWEQSTGPKTDEGKATVRRNGLKGGKRQLLRELGRALHERGLCST